LIGYDSSGKQCAGIYPAQLVGGRRPQNPQCIDAAAFDAQAAVGVCCIYWKGKADGGAVPSQFLPEGARWPQAIPPPASGGGE